MISSGIQTAVAGKKPVFERLSSGRNMHKVKGKRFHFIGAGGIGTSGLAHILIKNKAIVSGSDQCYNPVIDSLAQAGAEIRIGHDAANLVLETDAVVISAAVKEDNPELVFARKNGLRVYKYAEALGMIMNGYEGAAVSGTHGKSTTSAWLVFCLKQAGFDPNFIIGASINQLGSSSGVGDGERFVVEACEYDRSFLNLKPQMACILNIEADHLDYYKDEDEIVEAFTDFARGIRDGGVLVANGEDANVAKVIAAVDSSVRVVTFGFSKDCDYSAQNIKLANGLHSFDVYHKGALLGSTNISLAGNHNIANALAVIAMAINCGVNAERLFEILPLFTGIDRRLMLKDKIAGITILDDYAHHPTEIRASLLGIRQFYNPKRLWCIFQPHQYSRTQFLLEDFAESFKLCDFVIIPEIYFVRDSAETKKLVNAQILAEKISSNGTRAVFIDGFSGICDYLKEHVCPDDLVVTMGAGDIWKVADEYIQWLRKNS